jgi:hypothetical protein
MRLSLTGRHAGNQAGGGAHGEDATDEESEHEGRKVYSYMNIRNKVSLRVFHVEAFKLTT